MSQKSGHRFSDYALWAAFSAATFVSAALLFALEPMFTKMILPRLGGSASVWSVAIVFFQATLLAGYVYAYAITRLTPGRYSVAIHLAVMGVATLALPLAIAAGWKRPPQTGEAFWLIGLFTTSIGVPFFALSGNGPLLQTWFARTHHRSAGNPYFLYATGNAGSVIALLAYPFLIEPLTPLDEQTAIWSMTFYGLIVLIAICGSTLWFAGRSIDSIPNLDVPDKGRPLGAGPGRTSVFQTGHAPTGVDVAPLGWRDALIWMALSAIPSGLLIAVTAHVSTDVAPAPFLWVIPLALYLATFVIAFQRKPVIEQRPALLVQPVLLVSLVATFIFDVSDYALPVLALHAVTFFVTALVCHGELARRRPPVLHLTAFYMWMSVGGVIGGIFAALAAPHLFSWVAEYPLLLVLAILCRPGFGRPSTMGVVVLAAALAAAALALIGTSYGYVIGESLFNGIVVVLLGVALMCSRDPWKFASLIALTFVFWRLYEPDMGARTTLRSFFGVHKIIDYEGDENDQGFRVLEHGTTIHGAVRS
jgi:hypothetical protein